VSLRKNRKILLGQDDSPPTDRPGPALKMIGNADIKGKIEKIYTFFILFILGLAFCENWGDS